MVKNRVQKVPEIIVLIPTWYELMSLVVLVGKSKGCSSLLCFMWVRRTDFTTSSVSHHVALRCLCSLHFSLVALTACWSQVVSKLCRMSPVSDLLLTPMSPATAECPHANTLLCQCLHKRLAKKTPLSAIIGTCTCALNLPLFPSVSQTDLQSVYSRHKMWLSIL